MRITLSILGQEVWSLEWSRASPDPPWEVEEDTTSLRAGETHNFERDTDPYDPTYRYGEWEDKTGFGFGGLS